MVVKVEFVPDVKRLQLVSCCEDNSVRVWSLLTQKCLATLKDHFRCVCGCFSVWPHMCVRARVRRSL